MMTPPMLPLPLHALEQILGGLTESFDDKTFLFPRVHLLLIPPRWREGENKVLLPSSGLSQSSHALSSPTMQTALDRFRSSFRELAKTLFLCNGRRNRIGRRNAPHAVLPSKSPTSTTTSLQSILHKENKTEIVQQLQGDVQSGQQERYQWISLLLDPMACPDSLKQIGETPEAIVRSFAPSSRACFHTQLRWVAGAISSVSTFVADTHRLATELDLTLVRVPHVTRQEACAGADSSLLSAWETHCRMSILSGEKYVKELLQRFDLVKDFAFKHVKQVAGKAVQCHVQQFVDRKGLVFIRIERNIAAVVSVVNSTDKLTQPSTVGTNTAVSSYHKNKRLSEHEVKIFLNIHQPVDIQEDRQTEFIREVIDFSKSMNLK